MNIPTILTIATLQLSEIHDAHPWIQANGAALACAVATVESGRRDLEPYQDGNSKAFGIFGFHVERWEQLSRAHDWGKASELRQVALFLRWAQVAPRHERNPKMA